MSSIDKLALTCRVLYDQRVLEQRKEIEMLEVKYLFKRYTSYNLDHALYKLNRMHTRCKCRGCKLTKRFYAITADEEADEEAAAPEFDDTHLHEAQLEAHAVADRRAEVEHQNETDRMQAEQDEDGIAAREAARVESDRIAYEETIARRQKNKKTNRRNSNDGI